MFFNKENGVFSHLPSKTSFILGLIFGLLAVCTIGFFILLAIVFGQGKGNSLAGNAALGQNNQQAGAQNPSADNNTEQQSAADAKNLKPITSSDHLQGNKKAEVMLIEFSDFQCPYCSKAHETIKQLVKDYNGKVAWVYKHFPLDSLHPFARQAAGASECAAEQDKFWDYADELFLNQALFSQDYFSQAASKLGLNKDKFDQCLASGKYAKLVQENEQEGLSVGVDGTPGTYVNDVLIKGAQPYENFKQVIDSLLAK